MDGWMGRLMVREGKRGRWEGLVGSWLDGWDIQDGYNIW